MSEPSTEEWRPIPGASRYEVSDLGRVQRVVIAKGLLTALPVKYWTDERGARVKVLDDEFKQRTYYVHSLVAWVFLGADRLRYTTVPIDGNASNCALANLRVVKKGYRRARVAKADTEHVASTGGNEMDLVTKTSTPAILPAGVPPKARPGPKPIPKRVCPATGAAHVFVQRIGVGIYGAFECSGCHEEWRPPDPEKEKGGWRARGSSLGSLGSLSRAKA